jgi:hypothetical protein
MVTYKNKNIMKITINDFIKELQSISEDKKNINMRSGIIETLERKILELEEVLNMYKDFNNGGNKYTLEEIIKSEIQINAQISILRFLLTNY